MSSIECIEFDVNVRKERSLLKLLEYNIIEINIDELTKKLINGPPIEKMENRENILILSNGRPIRPD